MSGWGSEAWGSDPWGGGGDDGTPVVVPIPVARGPVQSDASDPLGVDIDVLTDLPPTFRLVRGRQNLGNAIARRLSTPAQWLADAFAGDATYGRDLRGRLNSAWRADEIAAEASHIEEQCRQDERVQGSVVTLSQDLAASALNIDIQVDTADGPFRLVLQVTEVGVELLAVTAG